GGVGVAEAVGDILLATALDADGAEGLVEALGGGAGLEEEAAVRGVVHRGVPEWDSRAGRSGGWGGRDGAREVTGKSDETGWRTAKAVGSRARRREQGSPQGSEQGGREGRRQQPPSHSPARTAAETPQPPARRVTGRAPWKSALRGTAE